jgi:MFS family permease
VNLLRDRRISALLAAEVISSLGTQMTWLALPWFVLRATGSPQRMTWVIIAEILPVAVFGFWGAAIAARIGTRSTMLVSDLARAPLFASIPLLHELGLLPFPLLLALVALTGLFLAPYFGVQRAIVPELVGEEQADVARLAALFQAANRSTIFIGPSVAGLLIPVIGSAQLLYVDASTYLVSFVLVAFFVHPPRVTLSPDERGVLAGARFLARDRLLRIWTPAFTLLDVCWQVLFASVPVLVVTHYHASPHILGWLFGAFGGGALAGAAAALRYAPRADALGLVSVAFCLQMAFLWFLVVPAPWEVAAAAVALSGFCVSLVNAPLHALLTLRIPRHLRPQAIASFGVFQSIGSPIGLVLAGIALAHHDSRSVLAVVLSVKTAAIVTIVAVALAERASLRETLEAAT